MFMGKTYLEERRRKLEDKIKKRIEYITDMTRQTE